MSIRPAAVALVLLLPAGLPAPASGQAGGSSGRFFVSAGLQRMDVGELNTRLSGRGLPTLSDDQTTIGVGLDGRFGPWLLGLEGAMLLGETEKGESFERSLDGRYGLLQAGIVLPVPGLRIYPLAGVGLSSLELQTTGRGPVEFGDLLEGPGPGSDLSTGGVLLRGGIGGEVPLGGAVRIGVRGGYTLSPGEADWSLQDLDVEGGPDVGLEGLFLQGMLVLSGGR